MIKALSRFSIRYGLIPVAYGILRLYLCLIRIRSEHEEELLDHFRQGGKGIAAVWHQRILLVIRYARRFREFTPAVMITELSVYPTAVHAVDGPRGLIKAGIIRMAQLSGAPIIPVYISVNRAWTLRSWDRFLIPKPFSTVWVRWDKPIPVPAELDDAAFETFRLNIEKKTRDNQDGDDRKHGWGETLF
jgi:lysophospholipid acyltransferase (LPLAT)-like uncharacterized protein